MNMKCKTVTLRKRKIKSGTQYSLCLDYYPGYRDNTTMRVITREALGIYLFAKPANQQERDFNTRMMKKAEILRNQRYEAIFNENHGSRSWLTGKTPNGNTSTSTSNGL